MGGAHPGGAGTEGLGRGFPLFPHQVRACCRPRIQSPKSTVWTIVFIWQQQYPNTAVQLFKPFLINGQHPKSALSTIPNTGPATEINCAKSFNNLTVCEIIFVSTTPTRRQLLTLETYVAHTIPIHGWSTRNQVSGQQCQLIGNRRNQWSGQFLLIMGKSIAGINLSGQLQLMDNRRNIICLDNSN